MLSSLYNYIYVYVIYIFDHFFYFALGGGQICFTVSQFLFTLLVGEVDEGHKVAPKDTESHSKI